MYTHSSLSYILLVWKPNFSVLGCQVRWRRAEAGARKMGRKKQPLKPGARLRGSGGQARRRKPLPAQGQGGRKRTPTSAFDPAAGSMSPRRLSASVRKIWVAASTRRSGRSSGRTGTRSTTRTSRSKTLPAARIKVGKFHAIRKWAVNFTAIALQFHFN